MLIILYCMEEFSPYNTLLWIFSKSDNFQIKARLDTMFDFFQLWETLQSELIARFLAVFSVFHTKNFFLGWYSFKFLILKFPKSTKMDFLACTTSKMVANGSKCDKWLCLVSEICNSALRSLKKVQKFSIWRQFGQNRAVWFNWVWNEVGS